MSILRTRRGPKRSRPFVTLAGILVIGWVGMALPGPHAWAATTAPRSIDATLGGLNVIGLERAQRPAVAELVASYARALETIQRRLQAGDLPRAEAARQATLAFEHLEHRLSDVLTPTQFQRFKALGQPSKPSRSPRR